MLQYDRAELPGPAQIRAQVAFGAVRATGAGHAPPDRANLEPVYLEPTQAHYPNYARDLVTTREVKAGEELFFDYGDEYWAAMGVEPID